MMTKHRVTNTEKNINGEKRLLCGSKLNPSSWWKDVPSRKSAGETAVETYC